MLAITHELARRLEMAEAEDGVTCAKAQQLLDPEAGAVSESFLGGYLLFVGTGSPFTHALGLGFAGTVTEADIDGMEKFYHYRGAGVTVDVCPYADSTLLETLVKRNYKVSEFANVLVRQISPGEPLPDASGIPLTRVARASETDLYAETVVRGFFGRDEVNAEERNLGRILAAMPGTLAYIALVDDVPVGGGQLAFHSDIATCYGDSTLTAYRRRGVHGALIRARLGEAAARDCELITAGTQPGSISQRDYERQGFHVAYTKITMVLD